MRVGMGYDVHRLVEGRKLILGGVEIPYEKGLLGHSDADVLLHAIMDALLGAAALGDIGQHFPDTDPAYKGASSIELLKRVGELLEENCYYISNIDATVIAQPRNKIGISSNNSGKPIVIITAEMPYTIQSGLFSIPLFINFLYFKTQKHVSAIHPKNEYTKKSQRHPNKSSPPIIFQLSFQIFNF